jgi:hypothetical protein
MDEKPRKCGSFFADLRAREPCFLKNTLFFKAEKGILESARYEKILLVSNFMPGGVARWFFNENR